jgi:hypothetical protein
MTRHHDEYFSQNIFHLDQFGYTPVLSVPKLTLIQIINADQFGYTKHERTQIRYSRSGALSSSFLQIGKDRQF